MRLFLCLCAIAVTLSGCATKQPFADDATIAAVSFRDPGGPSMTLYTMINNRTGKGGHSSLMTNARERIIFDPAGSFKADIVPERNDVLFGSRLAPSASRMHHPRRARLQHKSR